MKLIHKIQGFEYAIEIDSYGIFIESDHLSVQVSTNKNDMPWITVLDTPNHVLFNHVVPITPAAAPGGDSSE